MPSNAQPPTHAAHDDFWALAFRGTTPPQALALALREHLVPQASLDAHGVAWLAAWLDTAAAGFLARHRDPEAVQHRPWQRALSASPKARAPRLADLAEQAEQGPLLAVIQGFAARGVDVATPFPAPLDHLPAVDAFEALVALNLPALVDWWATQPHRPAPRALASRLTPVAVLGQRTPLPWLHAAALGWHESLLESLLDYGLDPNTPDAKGRTPLFHARTAHTVERLLAAGANPGQADELGRTAPDCWRRLDNDEFPRCVPGRDERQEMLQRLGSAAQTPQALATAAVLYVARHQDKPREDWEHGLPATGQPFHLARLNPGGSWKGEWSPAAWVGLQVLQEDLVAYYCQAMPWLLDRPDFLSPQDFSPRGRLTEHGLWGLAQALWLTDNPTHAPTPTANGPASSPACRPSTEDSRWELEQRIVKRWGNRWFWEGPLVGPIRQTTKALLDAKATPARVRESVERAWSHQIIRSRLAPDELAQALWDAKATAGLRFESRQWDSLFGSLKGGVAATLELLRTNDLIELCLRDARRQGGSADEALAQALDDYRVEECWRRVLANAKAAGDLVRPDARLDALLDQATGRVLGMEGAARIPHLRARQLEVVLPASGPAPRNPRPKL